MSCWPFAYFSQLVKSGYNLPFLTRTIRKVSLRKDKDQTGKNGLNWSEMPRIGYFQNIRFLQTVIFQTLMNMGTLDIFQHPLNYCCITAGEKKQKRPKKAILCNLKIFELGQFFEKATVWLQITLINIK